MTAFIWILAIVGALLAIGTAGAGAMQTVPSTEPGEVLFAAALPLAALLLARSRLRALRADGTPGGRRTALVVPAVISAGALVVVFGAYLLQPR